MYKLAKYPFLTVRYMVGFFHLTYSNNITVCINKRPVHNTFSSINTHIYILAMMFHIYCSNILYYVIITYVTHTHTLCILTEKHICYFLFLLLFF